MPGDGISSSLIKNFTEWASAFGGGFRFVFHKSNALESLLLSQNPQWKQQNVGNFFHISKLPNIHVSRDHPSEQSYVQKPVPVYDDSIQRLWINLAA